MTTNFIVGTAGHVDHGKTSLVKALTGTDTDRLAEEQRRGMTIVPGYASLEIPGGSISFIDVPGHERFVKNMVMGAHGIDAVMIVVACDDGIMPQTVEHARIAELLGIERGFFVLTKTDLCGPDRVREALKEIELFASTTAFDGAEVLIAGGPTGEGISELVGLLTDISGKFSVDRGGGIFRMPVDRVFKIRGHGIVVTGTAISGNASVGETVWFGESGDPARIRRIEVHGIDAVSARGGSRCALNLVVREKAIPRVHQVIYGGDGIEHSIRFEGVVRLIGADPSGVKRGLRVIVHSATWRAFARMTLLERLHEAPDPASESHAEWGCLSERWLASFTLEEPRLLWAMDRIVVRDGAGKSTVGGGFVTIPVVGGGISRKHGDSGFVPATPSTGDVVSSILDRVSSGGIAFRELRRAFALTSPELLAVLNSDRRFCLAGGREPQDCLVMKVEKFDSLSGIVLKTLDDLHSASPERKFFSAEEIALGSNAESSVVAFILSDLAFRKEKISELGGGWRLAGVRSTLRNEDAEIRRKILRLFTSRENRFSVVTKRDLENSASNDVKSLSRVLKFMCDSGELTLIDGSGYLPEPDFAEVVRLASEYIRDKGDLEAVSFKTILNLGRKAAVVILEEMDRRGITYRRGNSRFLRTP